MKTIQEMAQEAGLIGRPIYRDGLEAFAELVREETTAEANARANASWTLMCEKMVAIEREACAKVVESHGPFLANGAMLAEAIRARGDKHD